MAHEPRDQPYFILATSILVHFTREDALMRKIESSHDLSSNPNVLISVVTEAEIAALALKFNWGDSKLRRLQSILDALIIVPIPFLNTTEAYARIDNYCLRHGFKPGKNDLWIAATAHVPRATLITTDHDFDPLDGIFLSRVLIDSKIS